MTYYIYIENNKINGAGQAKIIDENINSFVVNEIEYNNFIENPEKYVWDEETETVIDNPDYEQEQAQKERLRLNMLNLTKADVLLALYQDKGITPEDIKTMLKDNVPALIKFDYASSYYRGDEVVNALGLALGYTTEEMDYLFENKKFPEKPVEPVEPADTEEYLSEELSKAKEAKTQEATDKAYAFEEKDALITVSATNLKTRASGTYHIEGNLTNNIKMSAYASTLGDTDVVPWNTKENVNILLNKTACQTLTSLMSQLNAKLWTVDFPTYLAQIDAATTADEVNAINIEYQSPSEVVDINITPTEEEPTQEETNENTPAEQV